MDCLTEKFQITLPPKPDDDGPWVSANSARRTGDAGFLHHQNTNATDPIGPKFNQLPPGMEIDNQMRTRVARNMPLSLAGETDVTNHVNGSSLTNGFARLEMKATDDQYDGEHIDLFYGTSYGIDDSGNITEGFVERNNMLDRL